MARYAAVDIGSNSTRLLVADATMQRGRVVVARLAEDREVTRLGESVFAGGEISESAITLVCGVLTRMAAVWKRHDVMGIRVVATSATRDASNQAAFVARASEAIGAPVETISGQEEARLIHLGVQTAWPQTGKRVLIVDVGGGSAELIASDMGRMVESFSRPLGAVRLNEVFVKSDPPSETEILRLEDFIEEKLAVVVRRLGGRTYDRAIATSATAAALICAVNRVARPSRDAADHMRATAPQIRKLYRDLVGRDLAQRRKIPGIGPRRAEIVIPGAAVFLKVLESFHLPSLHYSTAGVRDGIVADLAMRGVGRELSQLSQEQRQVVSALAKKFAVDAAHARRVASFAHAIFHELAAPFRLPPASGKLLEAACWLRDTGHYISDTSHHKHSHYLVSYADLAGFTGAERTLIALLCRYHRRALPRLAHSEFQELDAESRRVLTFLIPMIRLADALDRSRDQRIREIDCTATASEVKLRIRSEADTSLEQWALERVAPLCQRVFERRLVIEKQPQ